jgi:hypothetical protein
MSCPDCEFVHDINRDLLRGIGDLNREVGHWKGVAAQNKVWLEREAYRRISELEWQLKVAKGG